MALFSRRKKDDAVETEPEGAASEGPAFADDVTDAEREAGSAPEITVSLSRFGGLGASPMMLTAPSAAEQAAMAEDELSALVDNGYLAEALGAVDSPPSSEQVLNVARQFLQGHVFLLSPGDASAAVAAESAIPLLTAQVGDQRMLVVCSTRDAVRATVPANAGPMSVMAQPTKVVVRMILEGVCDGVILDPSSTQARAVLPGELLKRIMEDGDPELRVKSLLAAPRTPASPAALASTLAEAPLWAAVAQLPGEADAERRVGITESRTADGQRFLEVFSHPVEVISRGRGERAIRVAPADLVATLRDNPGVHGVIVDPAGPSLRINRATVMKALASAT